MIEAVLKKVHGFTRGSIPDDDANILDDLEFTGEAINSMSKVDVYYRAPEDCPFARGNYIVDIYIGDGVYCFKYPKEMSKEHFIKFCQPLVDLHKEKHSVKI